LSAEKNPGLSLPIAIDLANTLLDLVTSEAKHSAEEVIDDRLVVLPNSERQDHWFQKHPWMGDERSAFDLFDGEQSPIRGNFFWMKKRSRQHVSGGVHLTENWEDRDFTRNSNHKVGVHFFLNAQSDSVLVVLSNRGNLRLVELAECLTNTQVEIFNKWSDACDETSQERLHSALWDSFKLQSVNLEFYEGVSNSFNELVGHLAAAGKNQEDAKLFASRLLGRLIFVWFLRKMKLISDTPDYFAADGASSGDYYRAKLEALFFGTLNTPTEHRVPVEGQIDLRTPYLNGGLFSPREGDWVAEADLSFPDAFFSRTYEHFSQFNFTTDESTPEFEQVAIDPEMLGRVFESLLATQLQESGAQARKARGAFYTPREIVAFMCKEALRQYLLEAGVEDERLPNAVDKLLDTSDQDWAIAGTNSLRDVPENLRASILAQLSSLKVFDPACGSGAFPMGMLHILSKTMSRLDPNRDAYTLKLDIIQNSIYGSDIEPMAVEIARLRAWLALLVDEDPKHIQPLPNLDFKFVCADSLRKLKTNISLFYDPSLQESLVVIRDGYYSATSPAEKSGLRSQYWDALNSVKNDEDDVRLSQLLTYDPFAYEVPASFFDSEEMFGLASGFDIVIGNPPYISHDAVVTPKGILKEYDVFEAFADLYCYFFEMGYELVRQRSGVLSYITSNSFIKSEYGRPLRKYFERTQSLDRLVNVEESQLFETATVNTAIVFLGSRRAPDVRVVNAAYDASSHSFNDFVETSEIQIPRTKFTEMPWVLADGPVADALKAISEAGPTLKQLNTFVRLGLATGSNEAFVVSPQKRLELIALDSKNEEVIKPVIGGEDVGSYFYKSSKYLLLTPNGVDVPEQYPMLMPHFEEFGDKFKKRGAKGKHWSNLRACSFLGEFHKEKIVWIELAKNGRFAYSDEEIYLLNSAIFMTAPHGYSAKALTGLLNSKLINFYMRHVSQTSGMGTNRWIKATVATFPIPHVNQLNADLWARLEALVEEILAQGGDAPINLETLEEVNQVVSDLYGIDKSLAKAVGLV